MSEKGLFDLRSTAGRGNVFYLASEVLFFHGKWEKDLVVFSSLAAHDRAGRGEARGREIWLAVRESARSGPNLVLNTPQKAETCLVNSHFEREGGFFPNPYSPE